MEESTSSNSFGRPKKSWENMSPKSHQNKLSQFWKCQVLPMIKDLQKTIMNLGTLKGIPLESLLITIELATKTQERRREKLHFPPYVESVDEEADRKKKWDLTKSVSYTCNSHQISSRARDALLSTCGSPIKGYQVKEMLQMIDSGMETFLPIKYGDFSVDFAYISPSKLVECIIQKTGYSDPEIEIVFSGDGRVVRKVSSVAFFLKIIISNVDAGKTKWVFPFAIGKGNEKAQNLQYMMKYVADDLKTIGNSFTVKTFSGKIVTCKLKFCADGKFLLSILGMQSATGNQSCPFCLLSKKQWAEVIMPNCQYKPQDYARKSLNLLTHFKNDAMHCFLHKSTKTCEQAAAAATNPSCKVVVHGRKMQLPNLLQNIGLQLDDIVLDELHMFMRLFDNLLDRLLYYLEEYNLEAEFEKIVETKMNGVTFHLEDGLTEDGLQSWSYLNGEMAWKLLEGLLQMDLHNDGECVMASIFYVGKRSTLLEEDKRKKSEKYFAVLKICFTALHDIFLFLRHKNGPITSIEQYEGKVIEFCQTQINFFGPDIARGWYFHLLGCHSVDILKHHGGSILRFSCSAQERVNGIHGKQMVNCVVNQNSAFEILKLMRREIYFEFIDSSSAKKKNRDYKKNRISYVYNETTMKKKKKLDQITSCKKIVKKRKEILNIK